jgi:hypothetical protein
MLQNVLRRPPVLIAAYALFVWLGIRIAQLPGL